MPDEDLNGASNKKIVSLNVGANPQAFASNSIAKKVIGWILTLCGILIAVPLAKGAISPTPELHAAPILLIIPIGLTLLGLQRINNWRGWSLISRYLALTSMALILVGCGAVVYSEVILHSGFFVHTHFIEER